MVYESRVDIHDLEQHSKSPWHAIILIRSDNIVHRNAYTGSTYRYMIYIYIQQATRFWSLLKCKSWHHQLSETHPLYTASWHGHSRQSFLFPTLHPPTCWSEDKKNRRVRSRRSFLSWLQQAEWWSVGDLHQQAQPGKVTGNPFDTMVGTAMEKVITQINTRIIQQNSSNNSQTKHPKLQSSNISTV